jgi:hypothetical protein
MLGREALEKQTRHVARKGVSNRGHEALRANRSSLPWLRAGVWNF